MRLNAINIIALILVIVGAINWGLVGAFDFNLVSALFGPMSGLSRIVYILVGLAGLYLIFAAFLSRPKVTDAHRGDYATTRPHTPVR